MKTGKKNLWLIVSLCVAFVISMFFGVYSLNSKKAHATVADNTFEMAGAAVRMDGSQGLRFGAIVADNLVEEVEADDKLSFGAFIAPLDWMEYLGITTTYSDSYNYYKNFKEAYAEVSSNTVPHNFHITPYKDNGDGSHELCLTLGGVQYNNMSRTFFGLFCIVNNNGTPSDESDDTFTYARFGDNNKRSYSYVASAALTDTTKNYTSAQKTNLYNVLQLAFYSKNGINQATAESNVAAGTYLEYELELNTSAVTLSAGNTYDIKSSLILNGKRVSAKDVLLKYSSSDTDVATVSNSGRITAVANGTATITVTYANSNGGNYSDSETIAVTVASAAKAITAHKEFENVGTVDFEDNGTSITTKVKSGCNGVTHAQAVKIADIAKKTSVSFTITNHIAQVVQIAIWSAENQWNNAYPNSQALDGTNSSGGTRNNLNGKDAYVVTIDASSSKDVTFARSSAFTSDSDIRFSPYLSNGNNDAIVGGTFTVSNFHFGSGSAAPSGNAVNINSADNGSVTANVANAATGDKVYLTATPSTGYQLASLSVLDESENEVTVQANVFTMPNSAVTVSATFSKVTYSITNKVSDKISVASSSAQYGDKVNISVADSDYYIVSVTYRANGTLTPIYTDSFIMPDSGVIITDAVVSNDYDINLTNAKAYNANEEEITTAKPGEKVTIVANDPATGYVFDEWTSDIELDGDTSTTSFTMEASDVTISASYKLATYTITIDNSITDVWAEVGGVEVTEATYGSTVVLNTSHANSSVASYNGNNGNTFTLTGNITISSVTYYTSYTITVVGGTASTSLAAAGASVSITAGTPAQGKEFANWSASPSVTFDTATDASTTFTMPSSDVTITANYTDRIYNVTVTNGTASPTSGVHGTSISITAADAPSGKEFKEWTGNVTFTDATSATTTFEIGYEDVAVTATYKDAVVSTTLTVVSSGVNDTSYIETVSNNSTEVIYNSKKDWPNQSCHYGYAKVKCTTADVTTIAFKIYNQATGNSNNTLNLYAAVRDSVGSQNDSYDNNAKSISSVTRGSVNSVNTNNNKKDRAKFNSIDKGGNASVSITLAESISKNTEFYITFASMIDNGGFVGNFKIEFVEPVYYSITSNVGTISLDKESAAEGDTVTLTPIDNTKVVTAFNYTPAGGSATDVSGNTLTMPAKAVTINSVTLGDKPSVLQIAAAGKGQYADSRISASKTDNYTMTCTDTWNWSGGGQGDHYEYVKLEGVSGNTVSFTVANTTTGSGNTNLNLKVTIVSSLGRGYNDNKRDISSTNDNNIVTISTIAQGGSANVTITLSSALNSSDVYILFNQHENNFGTGFVGTFTVTNFNVTSAS